MTSKLEGLVAAWKDEHENYKLIEFRREASINTFIQLNRMIYQQCMKEGIDISSLELTPKEQVNEKPRTSGKTSRNKKSSGK